jgi:hypothetical protein
VASRGEGDKHPDLKDEVELRRAGPHSARRRTPDGSFGPANCVYNHR